MTGANTGLGQALALALAAAGADIAAVGRTPPDETARSVASLGRRFAFVEADLNDSDSAGAIVAAVLQTFDKHRHPRQ